jgi:hypothetical protein
MKKLLLLILIALTFTLTSNVYAFQIPTSILSLFTKSTLKVVVGALPETQIDEIIEYISNCSGRCEYGKELGKKQLSNEVLEDAFIRISVKQGKISEELAEELSNNLSGVPGYREALSKIAGNSVNKTSGHLFELTIANNRKKLGNKIIAISKPYNDGIKSHVTDIDLIYKKGEQLYATEVKAYKSDIALDVVNADTTTLLKFVEENPDHIPQFIFKETPRLIILKYLESKGIQVIIEG